MCFPFLAVVQFFDFVCCLLYTSLQPRKNNPLTCIFICGLEQKYLRLFVSQAFAISSWLMGYRKTEKRKESKENTMKCIKAAVAAASLTALTSSLNPESWNGGGTVVLVHICRRIRRLAAPSS